MARNVPFLDDTDSEDELPPGWEERATLDGDVFFVSHATKTTHWYHPLTGLLLKIYAWILAIAGRLRAIVLNKRTTYTDPRLAFSEEIGSERGGRPFRQRFDGQTTALEVLMGRDLRSKHFLITGASLGGIGFETARSLALHGAQVSLTSRDLATSREAAAAILKERPTARVSAYQMDLCRLASVRRFAEDILSDDWELTGLILNAGTFGCNHSLTPDGYEVQFQVNHLGHFYLTQLLRERLVRSSAARIVVLSSESHRVVTLDERTFDEAHLSPSSAHGYVSLLQYGNAKLCNLLFARHLALLLAPTGVRVFACHPGNMVRTNLPRHSLFYRLLFAVAALFTKTLQQAAATTVFCAVHKDAGLCQSGSYFNNCCVCEPSPVARREDLAARLWAISEAMVHRAATLRT